MTLLHDLVAVAAAHYAAGRFGEAAAAYRAALRLSPKNPGIVHNLGVALAAAGLADEAAATFRQASALQPFAVSPWLSLGHLEFGRKRLDRSEHAFAQAVALAPDSVEANFNLGYVRHELGRAAEALPPLEAARRLDPESERVWYQLFSSRLASGDRDAALADFLDWQASAVPTPRLFHAALGCVRAQGDADLEARHLRLGLDLEYGPDDRTALAGILARLQYFDVAREDILRLYRTYDRLMRDHLAGAAPLARPTRLPGARVRIGYMSADFNWHVMGRVMIDVIESHDRDRYAIHLYSLSREAGTDAHTARFRKASDRFVELPSHDPAEAARIIAADDCDVLVDLMGHTSFSCPEILAYKPARVIATHLGYHGAIGLSQVDFKVTDRHADLPDAGNFQIERPLVMASCVLPFRRTPVGESVPPSRGSLGIAPDAIVLGEFVPVIKLSPRCLALWREILAQVPRGVLLFSPSSEVDHPTIVRHLEGNGIDRGRLRFISRADDEATERARYGVVDLVLDTLPYSGGDTTLAALEAGVPVVTRAGQRHAERVSASILRHLGLDELVAPTDDEYLLRAIALANDDAHRRRTRTAVAARYAEMSSTHPARYTRDLEAALDTAVASVHRINV